MGKSKKQIGVAILATPMLFGLAQHAGAATQGTLELGSTGSAGDLLVTFVVPPIVRVTIEQDIDFGTGDVGVSPTGSSQFCVYTNQATSAVDIDVTFDNNTAYDQSIGAHATTQTYLVGQTSSNHLPYYVDYWVGGGSQQDDLLNTGYADDESTAAFDTQGTVGNQTCDGGWTHSIQAEVLSSEFELVTADTYQDTITIVASVD